jgi:chromosome segregation ATPase
MPASCWQAAAWSAGRRGCERNANELQAVYKCRDAEHIEFQARAEDLTIALQKAEGALSDREAELAKLSDDFNAETMLSDARKARILTLDGEVETLRKRLDKAHGELKTAEDHRNELTAAIKTAELALSEKDSDAAQLVGELSERAAFAYAQANEIFALKPEAETLTGRLDEARWALRTAEDRGHELTATVEKTERVLSEKESEAVKLTSELNERATLGQTQTDEIFGLKAEVEQLTGRLNEAGRAIDAAENRGRGLAAAAEDAERALSAKESELARLVRELAERSTLSEAQANGIIGLKAEVETLTGRLDEASEALKAAEEGRHALSTAAEQAEQALSAKEAEVARLVGELDERSTLSEAQTNGIIGLKAEVETLAGRLDDASRVLNAAEESRHALTAAAEQAEQTLSAKESEVARLIGELNERSTLSEAPTNEVFGLKAEVETLKGRLDEACKALNAAEDGRDALTAAAEKAERTLSERESEVARLVGELNEHSTLSEAQTNEILSLGAEVETLTGRLDEAGNALNAAEDHRHALTAAVENAERALSAKESEQAGLIGELNERSTLSEARTSEIQGLNAEVRTLTGRLDEACNALNAAEDHRLALTAAVENAERALSEKEFERAKLIGELNERSTFADRQAKELLALKAYVGALKERLDAADTELQTVEDRRAADRLELDSAIGEVMGERARFVSFHGRVAALVEQLLEQTSEDKNLARRARDLENRLVEQSRLLEASELERKHLREEIEAALKTEAERRSAVITEVDNHAKAEKAKLQAALDRANGDRTRLAYELASAKRQVELIRARERPEGIVAA